MDPEEEVKISGDKKKPRLNIYTPQIRDEDYISRKYGVPTTPVPQPTIPVFGSPLETFSYYFPESPYAIQDTPVQGRNMPSRVPTNPQIYGLAGQTAGTGIPGQSPQATQPVPSFDEYIAGLGLLGGGGGGVVRPDYSAYRAALTDQAQQLNAQIQAMYNQLAAQAGENVSRVQDIYGGASAGIGDVYGSATENIAQAYESAQQQAADQMARLGIEAAAPQILPTQALSQAEAIAGLEAGRAGGLSAAERYGASGAQFGSEMAQVAQQQGTEMNAAILASLQNRLAESLAAEQAGVSGGGGGGRGMSVSDMLRLQDAYRQNVLGELPIEEQRRALEMATQTERAAQEADATLRYRAAQLAESYAPMNPTPEELQQAYELALAMLGG